MGKNRNILEGKLQPPIDTSDRVGFSRDSYCVDKTLLIKELVDCDATVAGMIQRGGTRNGLI